MNEILILRISIVLLVIIVMILFQYIYRVKKNLRYFNDILIEIEAEKGNQKFLLKKKDILSQMGLRINSILYKYEKQMEELNITLESNKQLMTSLSHDVRTPMTTLIGYLDAVNMKLVKGEKKEEYLRQANEKAYDLGNYIDVLFDWFRLYSDEELFYIETADMVETTRNILKDWVLIWEERMIDYKIDIPETSIKVDIDINCYNRIINNIIQNILDHSKAKRIVVFIAEFREKFILKICDDGIGIAEVDLKYIFERLYKCNKGRTEKGNGLGLNIVKMLTEKMQGSVKVESERNQGTIFTIEFPIKMN